MSDLPRPNRQVVQRVGERVPKVRRLQMNETGQPEQGHDGQICVRGRKDAQGSAGVEKLEGNASVGVVLRDEQTGDQETGNHEKNDYPETSVVSNAKIQCAESLSPRQMAQHDQEDGDR